MSPTPVRSRIRYSSRWCIIRYLQPTAGARGTYNYSHITDLAYFSRITDNAFSAQMKCILDDAMNFGLSLSTYRIRQHCMEFLVLSPKSVSHENASGSTTLHLHALRIVSKLYSSTPRSEAFEWLTTRTSTMPDRSASGEPSCGCLLLLSSAKCLSRSFGQPFQRSYWIKYKSRKELTLVAENFRGYAGACGRLRPVCNITVMTVSGVAALYGWILYDR